MTTTYSRSVWHASEASWRAGDFGPVWRDIRVIAATNGYCFPPHGSKLDGPRQTQRAIIHQALIDNPEETLVIARASSSWPEVVDYIINAEARRSRNAADAEGRADEGRSVRRPKGRPVAVGSLLGTINLGPHPGVPDDGETGPV